MIVKSKLIKSICSLAFLGLINSCVHGVIRIPLSDNYIPEKEALRKIESLEYNHKTMNCRHKSKMYREHLLEKGIKSRLVWGRVRDYDKAHMWVEVYNKNTNKWYLIDPTFLGGEDGWEVNKTNYPDRKRNLVYPNYD